MGVKTGKRSLLRDGYVHNLTAEEQGAIVEAFTSATLLFLRSQRAVYLEGFGILQPKTFEAYRSYFTNESQLSRIESIFKPEFFKCGELTAYHRQRYQGIVELAELSQLTYAHLPVERAALWTNKQLRHFIIGLLETIKLETVSQGCCAKLARIGSFYALHNRQGKDFSDWFAGADIFLAPAGEAPVRCGDARIFPRPKLESLSELAISVFGSPLHSYPVKYSDINPADASQGQFAIQAFTLKDGEQDVLIFITDGARKIPCGDSADGTLRHELAMQILLDGLGEPDSLPDWPALALCEVLQRAVSSADAAFAIGKTFRLPSAILNEQHAGALAALAITDFSRFHRDQIATDGPFIIRNLVGITADEARVCHQRSPLDLIRCLKHRSLAQVTRLIRPSIFTRSEFFGTNLKAAGTNGDASSVPAQEHSASL